MGILHRIDRRREPRTQLEITLMVWGVDTRGERFAQEAHAHEISLGGALLTGLTAEVRSGDIVGILYGKRTARYRVVWVCYEQDKQARVAIHRYEADTCPWLDLLAEESAAPLKSGKAPVE